MCNGAIRAPDATNKSRVQSNGTGLASRQLRGKVGGVTPAGLSRLARRIAAQLVSTAKLGRREYAMRNIADLLIRFWQASQSTSDTDVAAIAENRDRSSMADFVRILQSYDQAQYGRS